MAAALAVGSLLAAGWLSLAPQAAPAGRADLLAAVFPPWWGSQRVFLAAAGCGPVAGLGAVPFVVIAAPAGADGAAALRRNGAWLVLDARLVTLCGQGSARR